MSDARNEYIRATFMLSKSDPAAWEHFLVAFDIYAMSELQRSLSTPLNEAVMALGMNRRMIDLRNDFRDIHGLMAKITR